MAELDMREFYEKQVAWYKRQVEFDNEQIEWDNSMIKRSRKADRELLEYVWNKGPLNKWQAEIFDPKKYVGSETKQYIADRRRWYRMRKRDLRNLQDYQRRLEAIV